MTGKQLRNSILQWAIQGKLVPQDPNDEPASVLLERIRAEKARLVKEKKIKKDKNESIIFRGEDNSYYEKMTDGTVRCIDSEIPFEIPGSWEWCRIKHICTMQAGKNIQASAIFPDYSKAHPYRCVGGNGLRGYVSVFNYSGHFAIVGRQGALCDCLNIEDGEFYATEHAVVVNSYGIISPVFLYYFLSALNLNQYATATAQPGLAVSNVIEVLIPLPPKEEQERIITSFDVLYPLMKRYENAHSELRKINEALKDNLRASILQEAIQGRLVSQIESEGTAEELLEEIRAEKKRLVKERKLKKSALANESRIFRGEDNRYYENICGIITCIDDELPFDIPQTWSWARLGEVFQHNTGKALNGSGNGNLRRKYLTTSNLYWDSFDFSKVKEMNFTENEIQKCTVKKGDLLVCEGGDIGRAAIWCYDYDMCIQNHIHRLRSYIEVSIRFFFYVLQLYKYRGIIGGKGIGIQGLSSGALHNIIIPIPPISEQNRIVKRLDYILTGIMSR